MDLTAAYAEAKRLAGTGTWNPGAWTPARCALWRGMDKALRDRLENWVWAEKERGRCHRSQLPDLEGMT